VPGLKETDPTTGWSDWQDPQNVIAAKLPTEPTKVTNPDAVTKTGTTVAWESNMNDRYIVEVGYTTGASLPSGKNEQTLQSIAKTMASNLGGEIISHNHEGTPNGYPGLDVTVKGADLPNGPAYVDIRIWLVDGEAVYVMTRSYEEHPDMQSQVLGTVTLKPSQSTTTSNPS
jgi:hypothetical protein